MAMQLFRNFGKSRASKVMMVVLVFAFMGWGITDYIGGRTGAALTVNGKDVPLREIDQTYRQRVASLTQMLGGTPPTPEMLAQLNVPDMVLAEVTQRYVLQQAANDLKLRPGSQEVRDAVMKNPAFAENGSFNADRYRKTVGQVGLTPKAFEAMIADEITVQKLSGLVGLPVVNGKGLEPLLAGTNTTYQLETFTLSPANLPPQPAPTDDALAKFHAANQAAYSEPEKRSVAVLEIGPNAISGTITIPEEQIAERFKQNIAAYEKPEQRHVRHILVSEVKDAVEIYNKIKAGEDFAKMASEKSIDPGSKDKGGDLGNIAQADVVPTFGEAAFKLEAGGVSEPVQSPFGWHVIKVESISHPAAPQLADVHERIKQELIAEQGEEAIQSLLKTVDDRAAGGESLAKIAESVGLKVRSLPVLTATTSAANIEPALVQAAFQAEEGRVQGPVTLEDGNLAYVELTALQPAKVRPLAEVKDEVRKAYIEAQAQDALNKTAFAMVEAARKPEFARAPLSAVAKEINFGGTPGTLTVKSVADAPEWLHPALAEVYQLPIGGLLPGAVANGKDQVLVRMTSRKSTAPTDAKTAAGTYTTALQGEMENLLLSNMVATAKVKKNLTLLRQVFGANWTPRG